MKTINEMETKSIPKLLFKFSLPAIIGLVVNALYNIIDSVFVGRGVGKEALMATREKIVSRGLHITEKINRDYFFSLYFREPGGVLFEIATDNPGFATDEKVENLGSSLQLPNQHEPMRDKIEKALPKLQTN